MTASLPIFLLTDFGARDAYVGQVKAVLSDRARGAPIIDLTHEVSPYAIDEGAWLLETSLPFLPAPAVALAVVDPGVGGERRPIAIRAPTADPEAARYFVGPDNGLLSAAAAPAARPPRTAPYPVPAGIEVRAIENPAARLATVSATFHGRDLFAPAAAFIARAGERAAEAFAALGPACEDVTLAPPFAACPHTGHDGALRGTVIHVDRYGNLVTTVRGDQLPPAFTVDVGGHRIERTVRTFSDAPRGALACHLDSSGFLAIAEREGDAAARTGAVRGDTVIVRPR